MLRASMLRHSPAIRIQPSAVRQSKVTQKHAAIKSVGRVHNRRQVVIVKAMDAAASPGGSSQDPYKVLEILETTPSDRVMASYNRMMGKLKIDINAKDADVEGIKKKMSEIETAYNAILMKQMRARLSGEAPAEDVKFADKRTWIQDYAPWAPKWCPEAEKKDLLINGAALAFLWAYSLLTFEPQVGPMITGMCIFFFRTFFKLHRIFPSPENRENPEKAKQDNAKFFRCMGLTLGPIAVGIIIATFVPNFLAMLFKVALPAWVLIKQDIIIDILTTTLMAITSTFYV